MRSFLNAGGWLRRLPTTFDRLDLLLCVLCAGSIGSVYALTRVPELLPLDGGEFQFLGVNQGHAHVTGYPVYLALLRAFTQLPLGEPILRATLFSAVMGGVAAGLAYLIGRAASGWRVGGLALAVAWATSATVWSQAVQAEVYSTASAATAGVLCLVLRWLQDRGAWRLAAAGIIGGTSLGVHGSIPLFAPGILAALFIARIDRRGFLAATVGVVVGAGLFVATFWLADRGAGREDAFGHVYLPWAEVYNTTGEELAKPSARFAFLVRAEQWKKSMFASPLRAIPHNAYLYLRTAFHDFTLLWIAASAIGLVMTFRRRSPLTWLLIIGPLGHHCYTFNYEIPDIYVFFIPAYLYLSTSAAIAIGFGLDYIRDHHSPKVLGWSIVLVGIAAGGAQTMAKLTYIWQREATGLIHDVPPHAELTRQRQELAEMAARLPANALVGTNWSALYRLVYLAKTVSRHDLTFIEARPWGIEATPAAVYRRRIAELTQGTRPLVLSVPARELADMGYSGKPLGRAAGLDFWLVDQPTPP